MWPVDDGREPTSPPRPLPDLRGHHAERARHQLERDDHGSIRNVHSRCAARKENVMSKKGGNRKKEAPKAPMENKGPKKK
jgi:hypothetical protein